MVGLQLESVQFLNESLTIPIFKYLKKLKEIKNNRSENSESVNKFIDKYYDDIINIANTLSKEKDKLRFDDVKSTLRTILGIVTGLSICATNNLYVGLGGLFIVVISIIARIIEPFIDKIRYDKDREALVDLIRIKVALYKIDMNKVDKECKNKIMKCIHDIEDCENLMDSIKTDIK